MLDYSVTDLASAVAAAIAAGLVAVGLIIAYQQLQHLRAQMKEDTYLEYSKRYNQIANKLPTGVFSGDFETAQLEQSPDFGHAMKAYVDLCLRSQARLS